MRNTLTFKHTKLACFFTTLVMSAAFCLPSLLFATFNEIYGISYTLLGSLVVVCFFTQLGIDLIFSFFGRFFNIHKTIRLMPILTALGLVLYATIPTLFPQYAYVGLAIGTFVFSIAAGLSEVLLSPMIAALPSDNPERDMSMLHSLYGYGVVSVVLISTVFLKIAGTENWMYLTYFLALLPVVASVFLMITPMPEMKLDNGKETSEKSGYRRKTLVLCILCIVLGSCTENTMTSWISVYVEKALTIPKVYGDIFGMCLFAGLLALTRTVYAKYGKNIFRVLKISMLCSVLLYVIVAVSKNPIVSLLACACLGVCTAMLWPGTLILMEEKIPGVGVTAYALMAAGGDTGASVAPQLLGIVVDNVAISEWAKNLANSMALSPEQIGFKVGMLTAAIFPLLGLLLMVYMKKHFDKNKS